MMLLNCGVGEDSWESLDCKEIKPVNPKGNQSWICIGRTAAEAEAPILRSRDVKNWLIGKDGDAGKDWRQEEKGMTEDEMVGWHQWLNGHEFEQALGVGDGQGRLAVHGVAKSQTRLSNWTELKQRNCLQKKGLGTQRGMLSAPLKHPFTIQILSSRRQIHYKSPTQPACGLLEWGESTA